MVDLDVVENSPYDEADVRSRIESVLTEARDAGDISDAVASAAADDTAPGPISRSREDRTPSVPRERQASSPSTGVTPSSGPVSDTSSRLPEAGVVRDQEQPTPTFEAPFSLASDAAETTSVQPPDETSGGGASGAAAVGDFAELGPGGTAALHPVEFPELVDLACAPSSTRRRVGVRARSRIRAMPKSEGVLADGSPGVASG